MCVRDMLKVNEREYKVRSSRLVNKGNVCVRDRVMENKERIRT